MQPSRDDNDASWGLLVEKFVHIWSLMPTGVAFLTSFSLWNYSWHAVNLVDDMSITPLANLELAVQ